MIDSMLGQYSELMIDLTSVVWEDVVCEAGSDTPKQCWIDLFCKFPTRFTVGSDVVGQFISPSGGNLLKPQIIKYWSLAKVLPADVAKNLLYNNAERIWFSGWTMPSTTEPRFRQIPPCNRCETLHQNEGKFE